MVSAAAAAAAGSRKQEAGSRKQEAGSRKQEAGSRKQQILDVTVGGARNDARPLEGCWRVLRLCKAFNIYGR
jgi:hypothetical protein